MTIKTYKLHPDLHTFTVPLLKSIRVAVESDTHSGDWTYHLTLASSTESNLFAAELCVITARNARGFTKEQIGVEYNSEEGYELVTLSHLDQRTSQILQQDCIRIGILRPTSLKATDMHRQLSNEPVYELHLTPKEIVRQCSWCKKSELYLRKGQERFPRCSGCGKTFYCSVECQKKSWKADHRFECKHLAKNDFVSAWEVRHWDELRKGNEKIWREQAEKMGVEFKAGVNIRGVPRMNYMGSALYMD